MSIDQLASEALKLSPRDRATLAEALWESLTDPYEVSCNGEETIKEAIERDRQLASGESKPVSHEAMMSKLRKLTSFG